MLLMFYEARCMYSIYQWEQSKWKVRETLWMSTEEHEGGISRAMYRGECEWDGSRYLSAAQYSTRIQVHSGCRTALLQGRIEKKWRVAESSGTQLWNSNLCSLTEHTDVFRYNLSHTQTAKTPMLGRLLNPQPQGSGEVAIYTHTYTYT